MWQGYVLPDLTEESAVYYHNECIKDLLRLSMDPAQIHNENLLVAAVILRTDEEMDAPLRDDSDGDKEVFLQMMSIFLDAQVPAAVSPRVGPTVSSMLLPGTDSLRQACFWVALRQEVFTSFMKQRPLNFPLSRCEALRSFSPAEDAVWADRLVIFCADVLQYCYGSSDTTSPAHHHADSKERWHALKQYEAELCLVLPSSFEPVYYRAPNAQAGEIFPEIWYLDDCHVTGTTHAELARILLAVYDPGRPKLGPGYAASMRELTERLRGVVLRLCGIALSNRRLPSAFIEALMGIAMCGEYFDDWKEQDALLKVLNIMEREHAFPTGEFVAMLQRAWGWK